MRPARPDCIPRLLLLAWALAQLSACGRPPTHDAEYFVFGTLVQVQVRSHDRETATRALGKLQASFREMHRNWHAWEPGLLDDINRAIARGEAANATSRVLTLVRRSQALEASSLGYFNPAAGGLVRLWGFHTSEYPVTGPPPSDAAIQAWLAAAPSMRDIEIDGTRLRSGNPSVLLDFGGVAKGFAVDLAMQQLQADGLDQAMVNAGGDLRARGASSAPWRVGITAPGGGVLAALEITADTAVFTSGAGQRFRGHGGARYPHVLNPRTGHAAMGLESATVVAAEGLLADAAATALLAAGPEQWQAVAASMGVDKVLVVDDTGQVFVTPALDALLKWSPTAERNKTIVPDN